MTRWNEKVNLITVITNASNSVYDNADTEVIKQVYCATNSIAGNDFYEASRQGVSLEIKVIIRLSEYDNQNYAEYKGTRYKVIRTYVINNREEIELHLGSVL